MRQEREGNRKGWKAEWEKRERKERKEVDKERTEDNRRQDGT